MFVGALKAFDGGLKHGGSEIGRLLLDTFDQGGCGRIGAGFGKSRHEGKNHSFFLHETRIDTDPARSNGAVLWGRRNQEIHR